MFSQSVILFNQPIALQLILTLDKSLVSEVVHQEMRAVPLTVPLSVYQLLLEAFNLCQHVDD